MIPSLLLLLALARAEGLPTSYAAESAGDYAAALSALEGEAPSYVVHLRRGWLHYLAGDHDAAERAYAQAVAAAPDAVEARLGRTLPLMALRRWVDAEAICREVLRLAPGESTARARLAWALYNQGRFHEATDVYTAAVAAWPSDVELRAGLGWSLLHDGRRDEARAEFVRVLALSPEHASATEGLAACR